MLAVSFWMAIPVPSSGEEICFKPEQAAKLHADLTYFRESERAWKAKYSLLERDRVMLERKTAIQGEKIAGLELDKAAYLKESTEYKALYVKADEARVEAENSKPSRLVWFASGVAAGILTALVGALAVAR